MTFTTIWLIFSVTPCSMEPCELHHGQSYRIDIHFIENITDELR